MVVTPSPTASMRVKKDSPFRCYLAVARSDINDRIRQALRGIAIPRKVEEHIMQGKRLRGGLTLLVHDILDGDGRSAALDLAAAVEIAHAIGLMIDDIVDGDDVRRGEAAVHADLGVMTAVLEAIGLLSLPYAIVSPHGRKAVEPLARAHRLMVSGALSEMDGSEASWDRYHAVISRKTGELFALSAAYGAMAAAASPEAVEAAREYGMRCGIAYQVIDDITDMEHPTESRGCSGPMLGRLLRTGSDNEMRARIEQLTDDSIGEAQKAAASLMSLATGTVPELLSCLVGAPAEMASMIVCHQGRYLRRAGGKG